MQKGLNDTLLRAAGNGHLGDVLSLLERGADVDCQDNGGSTPLINASIGGYFEVVKVLLEAGADASVYNNYKNTAMIYAVHYKRENVVEILKNPPSKNPDEVIFERKISNRTLEEIFNFVSLERISLIRNGKYGPVEAVVRESFSVIENEAALRKAFEEHVRRGGTADESAVFPNKLLKNKLPR
ncbi:MAG: ankyrin repeat domain-containing protein [Alphaproteobacteria bacterium]|nr:ankyrin repeat domain-containing protein [Alphaproteobacteria bacterium]